MFKKITLILLFIIFCFSCVVIKQIKSAEINPSQLISNSGFACGYPNSPANQCCLKSTVNKILEKDVNDVLNKIKICTLTEDQIQNEDALSTCLSNQEAEIILTLINTEKNDFNKIAMTEGLYQYILSQEEDKATTFVFNFPFGIAPSPKFEDIANLYRSNVEIYNNLSPSEKFKIQVANSIPRDKCLINFAGLKGFCVRGLAQFFAGIAGDNPKMQEIILTQENLVINECMYGNPERDSSDNCICKADTGLSILCGKYVIKEQELNRCDQCLKDNYGIWTGLGCINLTFSGFVQNTLFGWAIGVAGIIAFLCIIFSAIMLQTSAGNPERLKKAKQYLTSCIVGLLLIIFSIFILRLIGVTILRIPGLS